MWKEKKGRKKKESSENEQELAEAEANAQSLYHRAGMDEILKGIERAHEKKNVKDIVSCSSKF